MSEETTQDTGSQEVAAPVEAAVAANPISFLDSLPEDLRAEPSLRNFNDPATLAKSYVHAQRMIGADKIPLPGKSATDDEWRSVYQRLGAPSDINGYDFKVSENILDQNEVAKFKEAALEVGLNSRQAGRIAQYLDETVSMAKAAREQSVQEAVYNGEQELRQEWGAAFEQQVQMAYKAANTFLGSTEMLDTIELSDGRMLGDHPDVVRMFARLAKEIGEDNLLGETTELVMTPAEAQQRISEITGRGTPYWDKFHPEHQRYIDEALRLREYL